MSDIRQTAHEGFAEQEAELAAVRQRQLNHVVTKSATGNGDISERMRLDRQFRLVYVRCHFTGGLGTGQLSVEVDSAKSSAYNCRLITVVQAGNGKDVFEHVSQTNLDDPSPWTIDAGDGIVVKWTNPAPGTMIWGLECGFALSS